MSFCYKTHQRVINSNLIESKINKACSVETLLEINYLLENKFNPLLNLFSESKDDSPNSEKERVFYSSFYSDLFCKISKENKKEEKRKLN